MAMNFIIKYFVSGSSFLVGAMLLLIAALMSIKYKNDVVKVIYGIFFLIGIIFIIFSGVPVPVFLFSIISVSMAVLYFFISFEAKETRAFFWAARLALIGTVIYLSVKEIKYSYMPDVDKNDHKKMYVIGTSLSMNQSGPSYIDILKEEYKFNIYNLSDSNNTAKKALDQAELISSDDIMILVELGLNEDFEAYRDNLEELLRMLSGGKRTVLMFELPRVSTSGNFIKVQRELAEKYNVKLIPRRFLADAVYSWGKTSKHQLSDKTHEEIADKLGRFLQHKFRKKEPVKKKIIPVKGSKSNPVNDNKDTNKAQVP